MEEKDFQAITVQDITNRADVNRATFYSHYQDKYELLQRLVDETLNEFEEFIEDYFNRKKATQNRPQPYDLYIDIFEQIKKNADFYHVMLSSKGVPGFWRRLLGVIQKAINKKEQTKSAAERSSMVPDNLMISYLSSAYLGVIVHWLESGMPYTPEYMAERLVSIRFGVNPES